MLRAPRCVAARGCLPPLVACAAVHTILHLMYLNPAPCTSYSWLLLPVCASALSIHSYPVASVYPMPASLASALLFFFFLLYALQFCQFILPCFFRFHFHSGFSPYVLPSNPSMHPQLLLFEQRRKERYQLITIDSV